MYKKNPIKLTFLLWNDNFKPYKGRVATPSKHITLLTHSDSERDKCSLMPLFQLSKYFLYSAKFSVFCDKSVHF